jgi:hypothetical protein
MKKSCRLIMKDLLSDASVASNDRGPGNGFLS